MMFLLILLAIYLAGVATAATVYACWLGGPHPAAVWAALFWPVDLIERLFG